MDPVTLGMAKADARKRFTTKTLIGGTTPPMAKASGSARQAKGYDLVDHIVWGVSTVFGFSLDHGAAWTDCNVPANVSAANIVKVLRAGGWIWLGAKDNSDNRFKVWRAAPSLTGVYTWSAPLLTMSLNGGLFACTLDGDDSYVYAADYANPSPSAKVYRAPTATGVFEDVTPPGIVRHVHAIKPDPYNPGHVWMTTGDSGARIFRSTNNAAAGSWELQDSNWQAVQISFTKDWVYFAADGATCTVFVMDRTTRKPLAATPSFHYEMPVPAGAAARTVTDLAITSGSAVINSPTAAFTAADVGRQIKHPNVGEGRYIVSVQSATQATMSVNNNTNATVTATIEGDRWYDKAFFGAVDPATGVYYCIANDNSGGGNRSGLFMLPGIGQPLQLVQTFTSQITGEMFIAEGYLHSHTVYRALMALA